MQCSQHSSEKSRKAHSADAPYCRPADWWKNPDRHSRDESVPSQYVNRSPRYRISRKEKTWSIVFLSSGQQELTEAEQKFRYYSAKWKDETGGDSSLTNITGNMNYLRIISMGEEVIPFILKELQVESAPWFVALRAISEVDSVGRDSPGDFRKIAAAWVQWGKERGHI